MSNDHERLPSTTEAWVNVTMVRLMTRRLSHPAAESALLPTTEPTIPPLLALSSARPMLALPPAGLESKNQAICC
ncbi:hypothetical protein ACMHYB_06205 [Sorangium sp. So ce1128]